MSKAGERSSVRVLFSLLGKQWLRYGAIVVGSCILSAAEGILQPLLIKAIFDQGVIRSDFHRFVIIALAYLGLGLSIGIAGSGLALWNKALENHLMATLSGQMLDSYYEQGYEDILRDGEGHYVNRIYGDIREGIIPFLALIQSSLSQGVLLISLSSVLIYFSWKAFLILAAIIPISAVVGTLLGRRIKVLTARERDQEGFVLATLTKALGAFRIVQGFQLRSQTVDVFNMRVEQSLDTQYKRYRIARLFQSLNDSTMVLSDFLSIFVGALFVLKGALSFGAYLAFVNTFWRAVSALMQLLNRMTDFHSYSAIIHRIEGFLLPARKVFYSYGDLPKLSDVTFIYKTAPVFSDLSLSITRGEKVLVIGANGSGKTTLANLLSGFLAPSSGTLVLPDSISSITLPVSFPPLKVQQFAVESDIMTSLMLSDQAITDSFADELSAGQQQKLAIAIALSQNAKLYVLDEPLANLDSASREVAMELILEKTFGKTLVVVMHAAESYYPLFDRVIPMEAITATKLHSLPGV